MGQRDPQTVIPTLPTGKWGCGVCQGQAEAGADWVPDPAILEARSVTILGPVTLFFSGPPT